MTIKQFKTYVSCGLGRAVTKLTTSPDKEKFRARVLWTCLNDYSNDTQVEGTRAKYTYELASAFDDDGYFVTRIAEKFKLARRLRAWDFQHLCDVLREFAEHGNTEARVTLENKYVELYEKMLSSKPRCGAVDLTLEYYEHISVCIALLSGGERFGAIASDIAAITAHNGNYNRSDFDWFFYELENYGASSAHTVQTIEDRAKKYFELSREELTSIYYSPCASRRPYVMVALEKNGWLTDEILCESFSDSNPDTRMAADHISEKRRI